MALPFNQIVAIDYETRWSSKPTTWSDTPYTLSKMTTEEYIRSPHFKDYGACIQRLDLNLDGPRTQWYQGGEELARVLSTYDWSKTAVLAHNAQFDVSILSWRYGIQPAFIFDTLSMARALRGIEVGNSLMKLAEDFGLPPKGKAVHSTDGLQELTPEIERELAEYCEHDVFLLVEIFKRLWEGYPASELKLIDMTLKMYTRPLLELDEDMLHDALHEERETREALLARLDVTDSMLASNDKFAEVLRSLGVEPPTKKKKPTVKTPNPVGVNFAFAKNDAMFQAMLNGDNEDVALLCEARLKVKSTTERTRAQRFLEIAGRGKLPVPLSYYGAATGRWTAAKGSAINMQNLKRGSFLRKAIMAPDGYELVVADLSQIEPRVLGWLADYDDLLNIFRSGEDAYAMFGRQMFNMPTLNKKDNPDLRQSAKSALLGAGYGLGWASFAQQLLVGFLGAPPVRYDKAFAKKLGVTTEYIERFLGWEDNVEKMMEIPHTCTTQELLVHCVAAKKIIDIYRATAYPVVGFWDLCGNLIHRSLAEGEEYTHKGALLFRKEEIVLANGMSLKYPNLRQQKDERGRPQWVYGPDATKLYAGKITNNVTQGTARIVMTDGMIRIAKRYPVVGTVHDEALCLAPVEEAAEALPWMLEQMTKVPKYMPGIPLAAEGGHHRRYGMAKN
jgi:DNA polymerase bacteriophage-type